MNLFFIKVKVELKTECTQVMINLVRVTRLARPPQQQQQGQGGGQGDASNSGEG